MMVGVNRLMIRSLKPTLSLTVKPRGVYLNSFAKVQTRFNTTKSNDKKNEKILTDDLLAKAGFEDAEAKLDENVGEEAKENSNKDNDSTETRGKRKRNTQTSKLAQRERNANVFYLSVALAGILGAGYLSRDWDSEEERKQLEGNDIENGYMPSLMYGRFNKRLGSLFTFFSEPAYENLLPPPAPEPYARPLTLVLSLDDLLVHSDWDTQHGWRTGKRPGLDYFLGYLSQYYEIVVFGSNYQMFSEKIVSKLDPLHAYISYALFREGCRYKDGKLIKDLSLLNRDIGKVILIDVNPDSWSLQPENAIPLKPWDGKPDDVLVRLIPFLEYMATQNIKDVRPILNSFNDKYKIIDEFSEREAKLREQWKKDNKHLFDAAGKPNSGNFLAGLLGLPAASMSKEPKMPLDIIREHGQKQYEHFQNYIKENAPKFMEEEKKLKEAVGKVTLNKLITEGLPTPEDIARIQAEQAEQARLEAESQKKAN